MDGPWSPPAARPTDDDCAADAVCAPVDDECTGRVGSFLCVYPGGCRENADCSSDEPPFGPGETYCSWGECRRIIRGMACE